MTESIQIREAQVTDVEAALRYLAGLMEERPPTLCLPPTLPTVEDELTLSACRRR